MSKFAKNVFDVFSELRTHHRFVPVKFVSGYRSAALLRQEEPDVFVYLFVGDGRPGGGNLDVHVWVAPPDEAGGGLDALGVGYKVWIGSAYDVDDEFFLNCQKRIIRFLRCVPAMVPLVREEMATPCFITKRWRVYNIEQQLLSEFLRHSRKEVPVALDVLAGARKAAKGRMREAALVELCKTYVDWMIENADIPNDVSEFFADRTDSMSTTIADHVYAMALGELSVSQGD